MFNVFLDMTNTAWGNFGNDKGGRCAMGSFLWELGIPHDRLLNNPRIMYLTSMDRQMVQEKYSRVHNPSALTPSVPGEERMTTVERAIGYYYDMMVYTGEKEYNPEMFTRHARNLMQEGRYIDINFIIASPIRKGKSNALPKQDAKELVSSQC